MDEAGLHLDPFDHDGFIVSRKRGLLDTRLTALHPDGEIICTALRPHRTFARMAYGLTLAAAVLFVLILLLGTFASLAGRHGTSPLLLVGGPILVGIALLLAVLYFMQRAPESPIAIRGSFHSPDYPNEFDLRVRRARNQLLGNLHVIEDPHGVVLAQIKLHGLNASRVSVRGSDQAIPISIVPQKRWKFGNSVLLTILLFGQFGAMWFAPQRTDSWDIVRSESGERIGGLVRLDSSLGQFVLDLTEDLDRLINRRVITAAVLMILALQPKSSQ
ncbi:MAG: hypothetical protein ACF8MJ_04455 [Phycisphaerales bacterium JB050]